MGRPYMGWIGELFMGAGVYSVVNIFNKELIP